MPLVTIDLLEGRAPQELREDWSFGRGRASYLELPREEWR
jgi:hypothetical protein